MQYPLSHRRERMCHPHPLSSSVSVQDREFRSAAKAEFALLRGWFARDSARMYRSYMAALLAANAAKIEREKLVVGIVKVGLFYCVLAGDWDKVFAAPLWA